MSNDEDESWFWPLLTDTLTVSQLLMALISLATAGWALFSARFVRVKVAAHVMSKMKAKHTRHVPEYLLPRPAIRASLLAALDDVDFNTVLVYGQRGSGKTTIIEHALEQRLGVVYWTLAASDYAQTTSELQEKWTIMFDPWRRLTDREFEFDVCAAIIAKKGRALVVAVSVESDADPSVLRSVLHFCKTMSYNTQRVRFVVDNSSSRVAVALRTDLKKLRISQVFVGCITKPQARSLLDKKLPENWTKPQKEAVSLKITSKFDLLLLTLIEVCKKMAEGMNAAEATAQVNAIYNGMFLLATKRLKSFDVSVKLKLSELPGKPSAPNLFQENPEGLDEDALGELESLLSPPGFMSLVSDVGAPYIFSVDPFTERVFLSGKIMKQAFAEHYRKSN